MLLQAKRTNIGLALITHPRVLFLDEPTSGLDSYTSHEVTSAATQPASRMLLAWLRRDNLPLAM